MNRFSKILAGLLTACLAQISHAQSVDAWPTKPVRIIVPFAPGGGADSSARVLADFLAPKLGQPVTVENRPGAGSAVGVSFAAAAKDQHTLLMGSNSMVINPILNTALTYNVARDFDAVGMVSSQPLVLVVPSSSSMKNVNDVVAQAKAKPNTLSAGNSGNATLAHLTAELFSLQTGTSFTHVPYRGESALVPDLLTDRVSLGFLNLPSVITHIRSGKLLALATSNGTPLADLPGVPTLKSLGFANLEVLGWAALLAPKGIPKEGLAKLEGLLAEALATDVVKSRFQSFSITPVVASREATQKFLNAEEARWQQVIKTRGIKLEN